MISQGISHTAYDVMREYMIIGAELDGKYQIPMLDRYTGHPGEDTVDFKDSFSPKIKNHRKPCEKGQLATARRRSCYKYN